VGLLAARLENRLTQSRSTRCRLAAASNVQPGRERAFAGCAGGQRLTTVACCEQNGAGPAGFISLPRVGFRRRARHRHAE